MYPATIWLIGRTGPSAASTVAVVTLREHGGHYSGARAARFARERFGAESGAIQARQLCAGFANYPACAREGLASALARHCHELAYGLGCALRRAKRTPECGTTSREWCAACAA